MCAICGVIEFDHETRVDRGVIQAMAASMTHRGPDDDGLFVDGAVGLGFRRLSIIDLSGGHQPMFNEDGSAAVVFNGEIYNFRELAGSLARNGHVFQTRSDTETIVHAYEEYGDACVDHLRGMFAFAVWDRRRRRLLLVRDRLGVKPLYYYRNGSFLAFASEIKALLEVPGVPRELDPEALDDCLSLRFVPGPRTMFRDIYRLMPGHLLTVENGAVKIQQYWDVRDSEPFTGPLAAAREEYEQLLAESVRMRLISDVPLGLFLSGGLDSSSILALMSRVAPDRVKTFCVGYEPTNTREEDVSEFNYARMAADAYGAEHHEYHLTAKEFETSIPSLIWHLDEPMADSTTIPLYYLSKLAREHVTVILSGEGADETLGGYAIYPRMLMLEKMHRSIPGMQQLADWFGGLLPSETARRYLRMAGQPLERRFRGVSRGFRAATKLALIGADRMARSEARLFNRFAEYFGAAASASPLNRMLYLDTKVWLPDDLLLKADKMTMANSLELRVPFLDHKLVELSARLPDRAKIQNGCGKWILRRSMRGRLPDAIIDRPKKGFPVPLGSWLRGPLRSFTRDCLLGSNSGCCTYLDRAAVTRIVDEHEQGIHNWADELWIMLAFEVWHAQFIATASQRSHAAV